MLPKMVHRYDSIRGDREVEGRLTKEGSSNWVYVKQGLGDDK